MILRVYLKLKDLMTEAQKESHPNGYCLMTSFSEESSEGLWAVLNTMSDLTLGSDTKYTRTLWCKYLWPEIVKANITYADVNCLPCADPVIPEEVKGEITDEVISNIASWLNSTQSVYEAIINNAQNRYEDLFAKVENETFSRFNDTPQVSIETGFDDDDYATNTNKTISKTEAGTPVQRLREVEQFIRSYYAEWANDFIRTFIILGD